jgi:N-acetylmuramoyl-L-alanine amidase
MQIDTSIRSPNSSPRGAHPITMIVVHATAGSLRSSLAWLTNPAARVSCHYVIDKTGRIFQLVPDDEVAWHAGRCFWKGRTDINESSLGIELVNANNGRDPYPADQVNALVSLVRDRMARYDIPLDHVVRHLDVAIPRGRKSDPAGFDWPGFLARLSGTPEPSAPYLVRSTAWVRDEARGGKHIATLHAGEIVHVTAIVPGDRLIRPIGVSDQWAELAGERGYVWAKSLSEL